MIKIPIFPLNVVLFPDSKLPLYIFEERYKNMVNNCLSGKSDFGINLFAGNILYPVGCTAQVDEVVSRAETGEMNIVTKGISRYKIINYDSAGDGLYTAEIELTEDVNTEYIREKMIRAVDFYNALIEIVYKGSVKKIDLTEIKWYSENRSVSFTMAEKCGLSLIERQTLLEMNDEDNRLDYILKYLEEVLPKLKEADKISNIIKGDGYIQQ
ncbi:MAG TPA: LON peptidase substrate-binding domain-containing protein [Ignavibacteria bacterium]|nr:LON peptidase substrate-binding domain-containing protein [Ignavibacteria bacterium]HMR39867.1 LON peptidase substrate-binding domain-containing protein [Ignavibacteria bacterium]